VHHEPASVARRGVARVAGRPRTHVHRHRLLPNAAAAGRPPATSLASAPSGPTKAP
jgi:hypothetical protein